MDRPPSPDKRSRAMRNPLRRGPSSRQDMETIPSSPPGTSSVTLPSSPPRHGAPSIEKASPQSMERLRSPQEERPSNDQFNGDNIQPAPIRTSSLPVTNGVSANTNRDLASVQENPTASPVKQAEVSASTRRLQLLANLRRLGAMPKDIVCSQHQ